MSDMDEVRRKRKTEDGVRKLDVYDIVEWIHELEDEIDHLRAENQGITEGFNEQAVLLDHIRAENKELRNGLKYFACFKCDDDSCDCPNCQAYRLVSKPEVR